ncbi:hypothetical protein [Streptomyces sp900105755]|uniref:Lipoprotein n=1 Tax=Streptomyces sp. 900105755 TaxID=3154389 RepID=A0ABV1TFS4_9ACTN
MKFAVAKPGIPQIPFALLPNFILTGESTVKRRTLPVAAALAATAALLLTACGGGDDSSKDKNDKIAGAGTGGSGSPSPSASPSAPADKNAPAFNFPSDIKVTVDRESTGDATKDAVLRDVAYAAQARIEAFGTGDGQTANVNRYFAANARIFWVNRVAEFKKEGLTVTGQYRYYGFEVTDIASGKAAARYCEDQGKAYDKVIKTGKVQRTKPSDKSFVLYTVQAQRDSVGDWQVAQQSWKKGDAACVQSQ